MARTGVVFFDDSDTERPAVGERRGEDIRSIAHLKMLQSLAGKLNRSNDVREIGMAIANELRQLIDYHNCRVFVRDEDELLPIAFQGELTAADRTAAEVFRTRVGEGFTGRVVETGESLLLHDASKCEFAITIEGTEAIEESIIAVPLKYGTVVTGAIVVSSLGLDQFDEDDLRLLEVLAGHAAVRSRTRASTRHSGARRRSPSRCSSSGATSPLPRGSSTCSSASSRARHVHGLPSRVALAEDQEGGDAAVCASVGDGPSPRTAARPQPALARRQDRAPGRHDPARDVRRPRPLLRRGALGRDRDRAREREGRLRSELELLGGLAHQAKLAMANASSFEGLERTFLSTVRRSRTRSRHATKYTSSHARWITDTSLLVGQELGLDGETLKRLELGALFHDIGKIGIPNSILLKPGPLTEDERRLIETHPELGARIIAPIDQLQDVCGIVRACHERWDGGGYPDRKVGGGSRSRRGSSSPATPSTR